MANSLATEIALYLQGSGIGLNFNGGGTINCFVSLLPDKPDQAAAIIERGGMAPIMVLTGKASGTGQTAEMKLDQPVVQILVRGSMTGFTSANTLTENIFSKLQGVNETTLNTSGAFFHLIQAMQSPVYIGRDNKERHQWSQNYHIMWENPQR